MGLFYLLTVYCFIRGICVERADAGGPHAGRVSWVWYVLCVAACLLGMAAKEVMVSAPLIVLLYDRTFVAGSFREAWRRRWGLHVALAATWLLLVGTGGEHRLGSQRHVRLRRWHRAVGILADPVRGGHPLSLAVGVAPSARV